MNTFKHYFLKLLLITGSMLILSVPVVWLQIYYPKHLILLSSFITANIWEFVVFRLLLIAGFFMVWSALIRRAAKKQDWIEAKTNFWLAQRFRLTIWLIIFELLVCQNLLRHVFA